MRPYTEHTLRVDDGARIHVFEAGPMDGPAVLLAHAAGFHARCWDRVIALLPPTWRVIALDMRGHGRSDKTPPYGWVRFAQDVRCVAERFDLLGAIGVGHSLGGHCITQVSAAVPGLFSRLLLIDPVIFTPDLYTQETQAPPLPLEEHPVARRRARFASWEAMYERFATRNPYDLWRPEMLEDYCRYGVLPAADGDGVELACPPLVEASIYLSNRDTDIHGLLHRVREPVTVMRAQPREQVGDSIDFSASPTWPALAAAFADGSDVLLPDLTHFIPMQAPELVAQYIVGNAVT